MNKQVLKCFATKVIEDIKDFIIAGACVVAALTCFAAVVFLWMYFCINYLYPILPFADEGMNAVATVMFGLFFPAILAGIIQYLRNTYKECKK